MYKIFSVIIFIIIFSSTSFGQKTRCNHSSYSPNNQLEKYTQNWISENSNLLQTRDIITIPIVIHVVWNTSEQNISDEQIFSQIEILNEDFRGLNPEIIEVPIEFQNTIADIEIEFCLAKKDPTGNPTDGITRTFTEAPAILGSKNIHYKSMGGTDAWDTKKYLNIWIANGGSIVGFGSAPGQDPPEEDGIEIAYENFGNIGLEPPYHLGRTTTHEIGHYFNLNHVWGTECSDDDGVNDTPKSTKSYLGECPIHPSSSCGTNDMFMNFMYWTNDACMAMFTEGQKMRMLAALNGPRSGLISSDGCLEVGIKESDNIFGLEVFPNPTTNNIYLKFDKKFNLNPLHIELINPNGIKQNINLTKSHPIPYLNIGNLERGVYFLRITFNNQFLTKKIILTK